MPLKLEGGARYEEIAPKEEEYLDTGVIDHHFDFRSDFDDFSTGLIRPHPSMIFPIF